MALMIPNEFYDPNNSRGEELVYNALKTLEDEFVVFHSLRWMHNDGYRFQEGEGDIIVYDPRYGVLVIEIKSGGMRVVDGKWYQKNLYTMKEHVLKRSPLEQAKRTERKIIDRFEEYDIKVKVYSAIWLTSITKQNFEIEDPFIKNPIIFWREDLEKPKQAFKRAFEFYSLKEQPYNREQRISVINHLSSTVKAIPTGKDLIDFNESNFVRMTSEQSRILDFLVEQQEAAIMGGAGTGKTLLAVEQAKRLAENGKVLLLCYNIFLRDDLAERVQSIPNIEVHNIYTLVNKHFVLGKKEYTQDDLTDLLYDYDSNRWPFTHVIIDEGQDIYPEHIILLKMINSINEDGFFYVFYDKNQLVQQREELLWRDVISCQLVLNVNCRNTKNIAETSHSVLNLKKLKIKSQLKGDKATFERRDSKENLLIRLESLIDEHIKSGYRREDITILTFKTLDKSILSDVIKIGRHSIEKEKRLSKKILFTTARKFKGLESPIIILIDLDKDAFSNSEKERLFYVATSRAKVNLHIIFDGNEDDYNEFLKGYLNEETRFHLQKFAIKLNVELIQ